MNDVEWVTGSTIMMEIAGYDRGISYDSFDIFGNLMIDAGVSLDIDFLDMFTPNSGDMFDLALVSGGITGAFDFLPEFWTMSIVGLVNNLDGFNQSLRLTYMDGNGASVLAPGILPLFLFGLFGLVLMRRRRKLC